MSVDAAPPLAAPEGVWAPGRRRLTVGLVLTVTLVAFESLAISTVLPEVADDLGGLGLYGWVFSGFFLGSLMGIVVAGQLSDERGTRLPYLLGLVLFAGGLVVGGLAQSMGMLVAGRVAQGLGAGAIPAVAYVAVGRNYPASIRPRVFAVFSTAWVVPGLIGPVAATSIAEALSWRAVFLALLPIAGIAGAMTLPALDGSVPTREDPRAEPASEPGTGADRRREAAILVAGAAILLIGLGAGNPLAGVALAVVGGAIGSWAFLRLVPAGTARLVAGMPAAVAVRGIITFAFFGADVYVSLAVSDALNGSKWLVDAALTSGTVVWTAGSWVQQRVIHRRGPRRLIGSGFLWVAAGIVAMMVALRLGHAWMIVPAWGLGGYGMGLAYAPLSVTVLSLAAPGQEGTASASLQLSDVLGVSLGTGISGVFVALGESRGWATSSSLTYAFAVMALVALAGSFAARRLPRKLPESLGPEALGPEALSPEG
jgi:MFS family permease